mmetsp:Transcript_5508/g.8636  ORF Transcript_5508/g.8636 Transcript_5508/m.8636 type:complete len:181 (-) Transcript_5508:321-863(-)|eukprot:CAMPEP_0170493516 /NCGR_PEP_ID=MMETSP0208-20121228/14029_1 /TAXON_ID=197538 /ORGANISM="Strombidium inclinatum, Strain S3" /LENGTH=180 /DNA_ID=CAMNT_0010769455 /DNA_START=133 /DNA_END=675 /DNA_ORIENTATION=+
MAETRLRKLVSEQWRNFGDKDAFEEIAQRDYKEFKQLQKLWRTGQIGSRTGETKQKTSLASDLSKDVHQVKTSINIEDTLNEESNSEEDASPNSWTLEPTVCFSAAMKTPGNTKKQPQKKISNKNAFASPEYCKRLTRKQSSGLGLWAITSPALGPNTPGLKMTKCTSSKMVTRAQESAI